MGTKTQQAVYEWVKISDLVSEWVRLFKGHVYECSRFRILACTPVPILFPSPHPSIPYSQATSLSHCFALINQNFRDSISRLHFHKVPSYVPGSVHRKSFTYTLSYDYQTPIFCLFQGYHSCRMYFQTTAGVDYLVDRASMKEVIANSNWKAQANADIDRIRKSNITIR